ncbi:MAG: hypothetical protein ACYC6Y_03255 [Thermoguttaceae bacterium]
MPNRAVLTLAVLGLDTPAGAPATTKLMDSIVRDCGSSGRTFKSALIFTAPESADAIRDAARSCLAWEDINDDADTLGQLDEAQKRLLARNLGRAKADLKESLWRAYRRLYLLGNDNTLREINLGQITSSMAGSIVELILHELTRSDEITSGVGPSKLVKYGSSGAPRQTHREPSPPAVNRFVSAVELPASDPCRPFLSRRNSRDRPSCTSNDRGRLPMRGCALCRCAVHVLRQRSLAGG